MCVCKTRGEFKKKDVTSKILRVKWWKEKTDHRKVRKVCEELRKRRCGHMFEAESMKKRNHRQTDRQRAWMSLQLSFNGPYPAAVTRKITAAPSLTCQNIWFGNHSKAYFAAAILGHDGYVVATLAVSTSQNQSTVYSFSLGGLMAHGKLDCCLQ